MFEEDLFFLGGWVERVSSFLFDKESTDSRSKIAKHHLSNLILVRHWMESRPNKPYDHDVDKWRHL